MSDAQRELATAGQHVRVSLAGRVVWDREQHSNGISWSETEAAPSSNVILELDMELPTEVMGQELARFLAEECFPNWLREIKEASTR